MTTTTTNYVPTFDLDTVPANDRDRVAALIPPAWMAEGYVHRYIDGLLDFDIFDMAVEEAENLLLTGPTGSSKTSAFRAYAAARQMPFALIEGNGGMDPASVVGHVTMVADAEGNAINQWVDGDLTLVFRYGGVILFDEVNLTHQRVMAAFKAAISVTRLMTVVDNTEVIYGGRGGLGDPQPLLIGACKNDRYQGTVRLNEALVNQFAQPLDWDYDRAVEEQLVISTTLLDWADGVRAQREIRSPLSTNMLMELERHALNPRMNLAYAMECLVRHYPEEDRTSVRISLQAQSETIWAELMASQAEAE